MMTGRLGFATGLATSSPLELIIGAVMVSFAIQYSLFALLTVLALLAFLAFTVATGGQRAKWAG
ncbi:uncharacterized protein N7506_005636 [Penicillium brevicompactum]|uniref:uncharacterized protein n=1 Tax=Penicillium brevicompactum TaxID=5074 RepID=UPI00253FC8CD|nr:uncharacterized protein N7506_005636 [Penicillium brevicompactum]KAJ5335700.1 hypothetical protein N7506_005636 [Penicillium brevicompactum]